MLEEVRNNGELAGAAKKLLLLADVREELPTPVDRIVQAAGLAEPAESLLSDEAISQAPAHLMEKMRGLVGRVMAVLDRQEHEIHIRPEHATTGAFKRLHEVGHHIIPWQADLAYADDNFSLSAEANALFELEASHVAADLLFQQSLLAQHSASHRTRAKTVIDLSQRFGATIHSTFRRYVESHHRPVAGVVLKVDPVATAPVCFERQEAFCSIPWLGRFSNPRTWPLQLDGVPYAALSLIAADMVELLSLGQAEERVGTRLEWPDLNGELRPMRAEAFTNTYRVFLILTPSKRPILRVFPVS